MEKIHNKLETTKLETTQKDTLTKYSFPATYSTPTIDALGSISKPKGKTGANTEFSAGSAASGGVS